MVVSKARRTVALAAPAAGTAALRAAQLVVLVILSRFAEGDERNLLITSFGLLASVGIISDSGAGNFILTTAPEDMTRPAYVRVLLVHITTTGLGSIGVLVCVLAFGSEHLAVSGMATIVALSVTQVADSTLRVIKAPFLVHHDDGAYGLVDITAGAAKIPVLLAAFALGHVVVLTLLPITSLLVATVTYLRVRRTLTNAPSPIPRVVVRILEIGLSGALTALYSQAPLFIGSATLPLNESAKLAAATRIIQALEFIPSTLAAQAMPRLRRNIGQLPRWWAGMVISGATLGAAVVVGRPLINTILGMDLHPVAMVTALACAYVVKSGNYMLVAGLLAQALARLRLFISIGVGLSSVTLCLVASHHGVRALASAALASEVLLTTLSAAALITRMSSAPREQRRAAGAHRA